VNIFFVPTVLVYDYHCKSPQPHVRQRALDLKVHHVLSIRRALDFIEFGVAHGEIRNDVDVEMLASMLDWLAERFQDALVSEELDPGLIHRQPERRSMRIKEFVEVLRSGIANQPEDD
jgi:hypothetical protein